MPPCQGWQRQNIFAAAAGVLKATSLNSSHTKKLWEIHSNEKRVEYTLVLDHLWPGAPNFMMQLGVPSLRRSVKSPELLGKGEV